jgi:hypothetical protein
MSSSPFISALGITERLLRQQVERFDLTRGRARRWRQVRGE